ncbi:MAG: ABC transporter permease [Anaerolineae bacterium]|nr:ABC transporter permease [Anaerolineae bacterium]
MNRDVPLLQRIPGWAMMLGAILMSLLLTALIVVAVGASPGEVLEKILEGIGLQFGQGAGLLDTDRFAGVVNFWIPLALVSVGLLVTFTAGLWNIGVEGQMMFGAIFASWAAREIMLPPVAQVPLELLAAAVGGALWGALTGILKTRGGVHEIFGGVALNNLANIYAIYLISGPWQPPEGGSAQATPPFRAEALLVPVESFRISLVALALVIGGFLIVMVALRGTRWGLQLKALGKSPRSALLLGVPTERNAILAIAACGALAGLAGAFRVLFTYDSLRPLASGGIGFLGLLVVLLTGTGAWGIVSVPFVSAFFAAILAGSTRLKITLQLDQSLSGVLQGTLVLMIILGNGVRARIRGRRAAPLPDAATASPQEEAAHG